MKTYLLLSAALAVATPVFAQDVTSTSGSGAEANSGSISGAQSNGNQQSQANIGGNNAGIGSSRSNSESQSGAVSGSESNSGAVSDQAQGQSLDNRNTNQLGASNQQGVSVSNTFNSTNHKRSYVGTNTAVPLTAAVSFSSDYCLGTASGGASIAPIGVSIGGSGPVADHTCQYLRLAQTGGMMAANWHNMGEMDMRNRMMAFATWSTCMAGPQADKRRKGNTDNAVMEACLRLGLLGSDGTPVSPPSKPVAEPETVTPQQVEKYKTPRGDLQYESNPVVQTPPIAMVAHP